MIKILKALQNFEFMVILLLKVRDHLHVTGEYWDDAQRYCNINVSISQKIPIVFHNLKNYYVHIIIEKLGKFDFKINVIANGLQKYISFSLDNKLVFIDSFQFFSSLLDSLVKNLCKNYFQKLSQEFDSELHLVKHKGYYPYKHMCNFEKLMKSCLAKTSFIVY